MAENAVYVWAGGANGENTLSPFSKISGYVLTGLRSITTLSIWNLSVPVSEQEGAYATGWQNEEKFVWRRFRCVLVVVCGLYRLTEFD